MLFSQILPAGLFLLGLAQAAAVARPRSSQDSNAATMEMATATVASAPIPVQSGVASNCNSFYQVKTGDTCIGIQTHFHNFTLNEFYKWNPAIGTNCQVLLAGYYVCVGTAPAPTPDPPTTPSPTQPGIAAPCSKYYAAVSGDTCIGITTQYPNLTVSKFLEWNPAVGNDCTNLLAGYYYCVDVPAAGGAPRQQ
ncbi:LysM peptidoglycan-binding domain-containing protein [Aspergillus candidus]|uniref:LysM domain-containing protein n=1 Tax=Aspergillus candidus TaxID=41067 RepID=A0A2I2FJK1_ASPCN|nr:hypothetical protein BDW47DRAFT_100857 [Aspergillus candidus]PLB40799.1 hypothetical protein BDW47DRAFT_100857 [Aspergillus candidus]